MRAVQQEIRVRGMTKEEVAGSERVVAEGEGGCEGEDGWLKKTASLPALTTNVSFSSGPLPTTTFSFVIPSKPRDLRFYGPLLESPLYRSSGPGNNMTQ
jgi:hypothetical protein